MKIFFLLLSLVFLGCKTPHPYVGYGDRYYVPNGAIVEHLFPVRVPDEDILTKTKVVFRFSSPVTLRARDFVLFKEGDGPEAVVPGRLVLDRDGVTYTFIPKHRLQPFSVYHVYIEGVKTVSGGISKKSHTTFTTDDHTPRDRYVWWLDRWVVYKQSHDSIVR